MARYGGEEFVFALGETDVDGAKWVANHVRQRIVDLQMQHVASALKQVTVSCGVASVMPGDHVSLEKLLQSTDYALYQAKLHGRYRVVAVEYGVMNKMEAT